MAVREDIELGGLVSSTQCSKIIQTWSAIRSAAQLRSARPRYQRISCVT